MSFETTTTITTLNIKELNLSNVVLGAVVGAGGMLVAMKVYTLVKKRKKKKSSPKHHLLTPTRQSVRTPQLPSLIRSPDPPNTIESGLERNQSLDLLGQEFFNEEAIPPEEVSTPKTPTSTATSSEDVQTLLTLLYKIGEAQSRRENTLHRGISCNICSANPLNGVRFKCLNCVDYDVCSRCEPSCDHDLTHVFVKIAIPIPPLANPRTTLLPVFYPGKKSITGSLKWEEAVALRERTHFDTTHIEVLYEQYKSLCSSKDVGITKDTFLSCLGPLSTKKNLVVEQLFSFYDADSDGFINFSDFVNGMSVLSKGTKAERMKYIFKGYDLDKDGFVSKDDLQQMLRAYHQLSMELVRDVVRSCEEEMMASYDDGGNRPISAVFNAPIPDSVSMNRQSSAQSLSASKHSESLSAEPAALTPYDNSPSSVVLTNRKNTQYERFSAVEAMTQDAIVELVDQIIQKADLDRDGKLSESEFYQYAVTDNSLLCWFEAIDTVF
ncbi:uncharacterized protein [Clytia hemisphaerica]|uniref:Uncharacterized protein n=1 Tax=Clytia hemisphaerica TaxID=252671 RepID=A0A7M5UGK1_9CNID